MAHKVKHRHIKAKHQKKRYFRANDPLLSVFMWGVNQTVSASQQSYGYEAPNEFVAPCAGLSCSSYASCG